MTPALRKRLQYLLSVLSILLAVAVLAVAWGWWQMRGSLPQIDGSRVLAGLSAPAKIERDTLGVATITGETRVDVARAMGFAHAQDRFFQMDLLRRRGAGELSELFGKDALPLDKSARLHGFRQLATKVVAQAEPSERAILKAYTEGVNAGLASLAKKPWEYLVIRLDPQPWREEDSILCIYAMWFDLQDYHATFELSRDALRRSVGQAGLNFLAPRGTSWEAAMDGTTFEAAPFPKFSFKPTGQTAALDLSTNGEAPFKRVVGSNGFAISGAHTATGAAMVANDMHLDLNVPHIWYRATLKWKDAGVDRFVAGVSLPGTPLVIVGSNGHVAWGFTNSYIDTTDLLITELDNTAQIYYRTTRGWIPVEERKEEIKIKGEPSEQLIVKWTEWGPVVSDAAGDGRFYVLRWTAHDAEATNLHFLAIESATTTAEAVEIMHRTGIPPENALIGDSAGVTAWTIAGKIPNRVGYDGRLPVAWTYGDRRWDGWLKSGETPVVTSRADAMGNSTPAPEGAIWSGNNRPLGGAAYEKLGDSGYDDGARARQIRDGLHALIASGKKASPTDLYAVQLDDRALFLERWQKFLLEVLNDDAITLKSSRSELRDLVRAWNGHASIDSVAYRIVRAFRGHVAERALAPFVEQARDNYDRFSIQRLPYEDALWKLVQEQPIELLNPAHKSWESLLLAAVDDVFKDAEKVNLPLKKFSWGARNTLRMDHPFGRILPAAIASFLNMPAAQLPGDADMPRVQGSRFGQSERMVVSPGHEAEGILNAPGGQSGHPLSKFYRAGHDAWAQAEPTPFLPGATQHTLTLTPN